MPFKWALAWQLNLITVPKSGHSPIAVTGEWRVWAKGVEGPLTPSLCLLAPFSPPSDLTICAAVCPRQPLSTILQMRTRMSMEMPESQSQSQPLSQSLSQSQPNLLLTSQLTSISLSANVDAVLFILTARKFSRFTAKLELGTSVWNND